MNVNTINKVVRKVTDNIIKRSKKNRTKYLNRIKLLKNKPVARDLLSCGNLAHSIAGCNKFEKQEIIKGSKPNIAIVSAYNDMLSAHKPYEIYPRIIKNIINQNGGTCQFAGGVPAMCDGVTQGQVGMELSLFSRDVIAQSTAIALSHNVFDGALMLGVCDKIVPGLLMGCLAFGHLPIIFVPAGPMSTGLSNSKKSASREAYLKNQITKSELLKVESKAYHSPGTCTFYGTANTNQLLLEMMGLMLPGAAFINPESKLRQLFTDKASKRIIEICSHSNSKRPIGEIINEQAIVNAIVGLLASGGSTNLTIHLIAVAKFAGIIIKWEDFADLSKVVPIITRVYPNGEADINDFHKAGGTGYLINELCKNNLLHKDIITINKNGFKEYTKKPIEINNKISFRILKKNNNVLNVLRPAKDPFNLEGGINIVSGNIGKGIVKTSSLEEKHLTIRAPAKVFTSQEEVKAAFKKGELNKDCVIIVTHQGPKSNGMPELHALNPTLSVIQSLGYKIALITDGRMSGASGKVLSVVHASPEALDNGPISKIQNSDLVEINAKTGTMNLIIDNQDFKKRKVNLRAKIDNSHGFGRELFKTFRKHVTTCEEGAISIG